MLWSSMVKVHCVLSTVHRGPFRAVRRHIPLITGAVDAIRFDHFESVFFNLFLEVE